MKPLQLTEDQKAKLLEMCKVLFPEYPNLKVRNSMEDFCMEQDNCFIELQESGRNSRKDTIIHWFEFCMTHLVDKLSLLFAEKEEEDDNCLKDEYMFLLSKVNNKIHPIDYLYTEFQKLNK